jgi:hypothetical protein
MTAGKAATLTAAFVGVFVVGVAVGPSVRDRLSFGHTPMAAPSVDSAEPIPPAPAASPARVNPPRAKAATLPRKGTSPNAVASNTAPSSTLPASEPRLHARLKPVLNRGARMDIAADGFRSAEEFAAVAHAARNTNVPFMVLKHRVVAEGRTLADAIHDTKPDVDARVEAARAEAAAKSDIAAVVG